MKCRRNSVNGRHWWAKNLKQNCRKSGRNMPMKLRSIEMILRSNLRKKMVCQRHSDWWWLNININIRFFYLFAAKCTQRIALRENESGKRGSTTRSGTNIQTEIGWFGRKNPVNALLLILMWYHWFPISFKFSAFFIRSDMEILHQREIKDIRAAHSMERSSLEQRDLQNSNEIETLHRKCRCLTKL